MPTSALHAGLCCLQVYVLSGSGVLSGWSTMNTSSSSSSSSSSGGGGGGGSATHATPTWALRPGVSALSWANSTHVSATHQLMQHPSKEQQQQQQQPQLALLKFLIPLALLDPASDDYGDTEAARSVLQGLGCTLQHGQVQIDGHGGTRAACSVLQGLGCTLQHGQ
eukprot:scaffold56066_cov16-Tisochrysis_lutea.AAC.1